MFKNNVPERKIEKGYKGNKIQSNCKKKTNF